MDDLIKRLESATEGSRELDWRIAGQPAFADGAPNYNVPHYTTSLDAALSLVPEGYSWGVRHSGYGAADAEIWNPARRPGFYSDAVRVQARDRTPALALCIAALKAQKESR